MLRVRPSSLSGWGKPSAAYGLGSDSRVFSSQQYNTCTRPVHVQFLSTSLLRVHRHSVVSRDGTKCNVADLSTLRRLLDGFARSLLLGRTTDTSHLTTMRAS